MKPTNATEQTKTALENSVNWFLASKLQGTNITIATNKYITANNVLVYLTRCNVSETTVPRIKVQILQRVAGGVEETGYQLFDDRRLEKYVNAMIFGQAAGDNHGDTAGAAVTEDEGQELLALVNGLQTARQTL